MNMQTHARLGKASAREKKRRATALAARKTVRRTLPRHKQLVLQPVSLLLLLCIGVLLVACTLKVLADSYTVHAVVPAPALITPAVITAPTSGMQFTKQTTIVQGTCPDASYVTLSDNGIVAGVESCSSGGFSISLDLSPGSNQLQAQDYNITDDAGPTSLVVTVTYTPLGPSAPSSSSGSSPTQGRSTVSSPSSLRRRSEPLSSGGILLK